MQKYPGPVAAEREPESDAAAPETPQAVAEAWVRAVMVDRDLRAAWPITDDTLRLVLAQDWIWSFRHHPVIGHDSDWDGLADALATCPSDHRLWDRFASDLIELWQKIWKGFGTDEWTVWDQPEVLGLDLEIVSFVEPDEDEAPTKPGRSTFSRRFALRHTDDGWKVASINGEQMFVPGWPPSLADQPM
jgi:hypothetical protein